MQGDGLLECKGRLVKYSMNNLSPMTRPKLDVAQFNQALTSSLLSEEEELIIEYIRYTGIFDELKIRKDLSLPSKPPALWILAQACEKIGEKIPEHFTKIKSWSKSRSEDAIAWDGDLVCCIVYNCDGLEISPTSGTALYHTFAVHRELFLGINY